MKQYRKWVTFGRLASIVLSRDDPRPALVRETELANRLGLSRATLRHYRDAVANVRLALPISERPRLFRHSAVAANTVARWYGRDPKGVNEFIAQQWPRSDAEIIAAAREARKHKANKKTQIGFHELLQRVLTTSPPMLDGVLADLIEFELVDSNGGYRLQAATSKIAQFLGIDVELFYRHLPSYKKPNGELRVGFIEIGRLVTLERYRQQARDIWLRAFAASLHYDLVTLVFPGPAARRRFLMALPEELTGEKIPALLKRGAPCASSQITYRPNAHTGTVLVSTRFGLGVDLLGNTLRGERHWQD